MSSCAGPPGSPSLTVGSCPRSHVRRLLCESDCSLSNYDDGYQQQERTHGQAYDHREPDSKADSS